MSSLLSLLTKESVDALALGRIYFGFREKPTFPSDAIRAMRQLDSGMAWRAAWLLRRLAQEQRLSDEIVVRVAESADEMTHWIARLNLCQLFSLTGCPKSGRESLYPFLVECFVDRRAMVRAWAISALATIAGDECYRSRGLEMIREAHKDSAKSMRARLRHVTVPDETPDPVPAGLG